MNIKALFLDFYGTLVYEDGEIINRICEKIRKTSPYCPDTREIATYWWEKFFSSCVVSYGKNFRLQRDIEMGSLRKTLQRFDCNYNAEDLSEELFSYWMKPPVFQDTLQFFDKVKLPICIVSNIDRADLINAVCHHGIKATSSVTSEDVRSYKPRPEIFIRSMEIMEVRPEEVLHIGDSLSSDVAGAKGLGINTCWLNRNRKNNSSGHRSDIECCSLLELIEYIEV
ncbi:MAG: HAD family hydrolase [Clostridiaceae bacterium]